MLEDLVHNVEARLLDLGRRLLEPGPQTKAQDEAECAAAELRERRTALQRACTERAAVQKRLKENQKLVACLPGLIQTCLRREQPEEAWRHALELDRARQAVAEDEVALPRLSQVCWSLHFQVRQLERRLIAQRERPSPAGPPEVAR
jgi:hypothetical protein